jgi:hypothetical protein
MSSPYYFLNFFNNAISPKFIKKGEIFVLKDKNFKTFFYQTTPQASNINHINARARRAAAQKLPSIVSWKTKSLKTSKISSFSFKLYFVIAELMYL